MLAVYAHPDDADVACGGTLARWAKAGSAVHLVVCTDGGKGTADPGVEPKKLAAERAGELEAASALVGLASVENLGFPDGELTDSDELPAHAGGPGAHGCAPTWCAATTRRPSSSARTTSTTATTASPAPALLDAVAPAAALPHYFPDAGPPHQVSTVLLSGTLEPDDWVDVGRHHRDQGGGGGVPPEPVRRPGRLGRRRGAPAGRGGGPAGRRGLRRGVPPVDPRWLSARRCPPSSTWTWTRSSRRSRCSTTPRWPASR